MAHKLMEKVLKLFRQRGTISSSRVILALFGGLIIVGTLLLMLPFSYAGEQHVRFIDALFKKRCLTHGKKPLSDRKSPCTGLFFMSLILRSRLLSSPG